MIIKIIRKEFTDTYSLGEMYINDKFFCYTMEDTDRNINEDLPTSAIKEVKVPKRTAIPYGDYRIVLSFSKKLKRYLPLILDVPAFRGIRIHKGSTHEWSSGCVLVGMRKGKDKLLDIVEAENKLIEILESVNKTEAIYIKITK